MSNYIVIDTEMTSVADAIRTKGNTQSPLEFPSGFESAIANLGTDTSTLAALIDRSITEITIPDGVTSIENYAFASCTKLASVKIPSNVTNIGLNAFAGCTKIASVTCEAVTPPKLGLYAIDGVPAACAIYVPAASVDAYKAASGWSNRAAYIQAIPT